MSGSGSWRLRTSRASCSGSGTCSRQRQPIPGRSPVEPHWQRPLWADRTCPLAWDMTTGSSAVTVAVIDSGIANHNDLNGVANSATYVPSGRFLPGYDFISQPSREGRPTSWRMTAMVAIRTRPIRATGSPWPTRRTMRIAVTPAKWRPTRRWTAAGTAHTWQASWRLRPTMPSALRALAGTSASCRSGHWASAAAILSDIAEAVRWAAGLPVQRRSGQSVTRRR